MRCPKCDADISGSFEEDDSSCGIIGGWFCETCDEGYAYWEYSDDSLED